MDEYSLDPRAGDIRRNVRGYVDSAVVALICLSAHSVRAPWIQTEVDWCAYRYQNDALPEMIPVMIGSVPQDQIPYQLRLDSWLRKFSLPAVPGDSDIDKLIDTVRVTLGKDVIPAASIAMTEAEAKDWLDDPEAQTLLQPLCNAVGMGWGPGQSSEKQVFRGPSYMVAKGLLPGKILQAGISIDQEFRPGDLGQLIYIHGVQNFADYGFNYVHEAYCAKIAVEFILDPDKRRSRAWLARKEGKVVGSIFIVERPENQAQLRLLFVDRTVRGVGLGRWLVEESIRYCSDRGFDLIYLWTVAGLDRAIAIYESVGFVRVADKPVEEWGKNSFEVRFDLRLRAH